MAGLTAQERLAILASMAPALVLETQPLQPLPAPIATPGLTARLGPLSPLPPLTTPLPIIVPRTLPTIVINPPIVTRITPPESSIGGITPPGSPTWKPPSPTLPRITQIPRVPRPISPVLPVNANIFRDPLIVTPDTDKKVQDIPDLDVKKPCAWGEQGRRRTMEDSYVLAQLGPGIFLYGVFDGHAGNLVSQTVANKLPKFISNELRKLSANADGNQMGKALTRAFLRQDAEIFEIFDQRPGGSTAIVALDTPNWIVLANLGDSRGVVFDPRSEIITTVDHKPGDLLEMERIRKANHIVTVKEITTTRGLIKIFRVDGILAVSRAFGDNRFKVDYFGDYAGATAPVSPVPDIYVLRKDPATNYKIFLACDGYWDVNTVNEAREELRNLPQTDTCKNMSLNAIAKGSTDNVSVVIAHA